MKFSLALLLSTAAVSVSAFGPASSTIRSTIRSTSTTSTSLQQAAAAASDASSDSSTTTTVARNPNFTKLAGGYLFPEIGRRRNAYLKEHPEHRKTLISLGIGDTTQPIPKHILAGLVEGASRLGDPSTYSGYGDGQGQLELREKIADKLYHGIIDASEVFVSDGAKCDIMRLQQMFGAEVKSAVQDPSYPVYVDTSVMMGQTGNINGDTSQYENIVYMPCNAENGFFPDYAAQPRADVVYLCSPK
jgi:LL-diaminopimelate aminotransferase